MVPQNPIYTIVHFKHVSCIHTAHPANEWIKQTTSAAFSYAGEPSPLARDFRYSIQHCMIRNAFAAAVVSFALALCLVNVCICFCIDAKCLLQTFLL